MSNKMIRLLMLLSVSAALAAGFFAAAAHAQPYPNKPIRYIVPFPAGGPLDVFSRAFTPFLAESLGQSVIVENIGGAAASIGLDRVAKSAPDGYTIGLGNTGGLTINPSLYGSKLPYDPLKDFTPIALTVTYVNILVVNTELPVRSVSDLVGYAKNNPGKVRFGSAGNGSSNHLSGEILKSITGTQMDHIPYKGSAQALIDVIGGQLTFMFDSLNTSLPQIRAGKVRALAVTSATRSSYAPEVPTMEEAGVPGYAEAGADLWFGIVAPKGLPVPIRDKLNEHIVRVMGTPAMNERVKAQFLERRTSTPDEFRQVIEADIGKWSKIVKASGARLD